MTKCKDCIYWNYNSNRWGKYTDPELQKCGECGRSYLIFGNWNIAPHIRVWTADGQCIGKDVVSAFSPDFGCVFGRSKTDKCESCGIPYNEEGIGNFTDCSSSFHYSIFKSERNQNE